MSRNKQKPTEKDEAANVGAKANASLTMEDMTTLFAQQKETLSAEFRSSFESLNSKLDHINSTISDHGVRISSLEEDRATIDHRLTQLEDSYQTLQKENDMLKDRLADLEGRSRRSNIRIIGLPENFGGPRPTIFFSELLVEVLGHATLSSPPGIDRAHRSLAPKPALGAKPRAVILCLHRFQIKELIIREARKRGDLSYKGHPLRIYEDYTPEVMKLRREYRAPMAELYTRGYRPALLFPAKLRIILPSGDKKWLSSAPEANKFVADLDRAT